MDRREVLKGSLLAAALPQRVGSQSASATEVHSAHRTSRLFDSVSREGHDLISAVVPAGSVLATLHGNVRSGQFAVTGTSVTGSREWHFPLPEGYYSGLATAENGVAMHLYAFSCRDGGKSRRNCILRLNLNDGTTTLVGQLSDGIASGKLMFVGPSYFVRILRKLIEVWSVAKPVSLLTTSTLPFSEENSFHMDIFSPTLIGLTSRNGNTMTTVAIPGGDTKLLSLSSPEITAAHNAAQIVMEMAKQLPPSAKQASLNILSVTGVDSHLLQLLALVLPVRIGQPVPIISIDSAGVVALRGHYSVRLSSGPVKLICAATELGIVYSDSSIDWYHT